MTGTAQQSRQAHLAPRSPRRLWWKQTSSFTPTRWAPEQRHRDLQHLQMILQVLSLLQWCLDPASFYTSLWQRLHLSWRANIVNMRLLHWVHWDFRLEMYIHIKTHSPVPIQPTIQDPTVALLQVREIKSRRKMVLAISCHTPLSLEMPFPTRNSLLLPKHLCRFLLSAIRFFFLLALRRYNKSWVYMINGEGLIHTLIPY